MALNTVKKISIKNPTGEGYESKLIGAEAENIEVALDESGRVVAEGSTGSARKDSLSQVLRDNLFKPDGTTITADEQGVLHGANTYILPAATTTSLGGIKADGTTITVDPDGTLHGSTNIDVDAALSTVSENPIQNKVITEKLNNAAYLSEGATVTDTVPRDADILGGQYTAADITEIKNPIFNDTGSDPGVSSFADFMSAFVSQISLNNLYAKLKAGLRYVVDKSLIVDNCSSQDGTQILSAKQGFILSKEIDKLKSNMGKTSVEFKDITTDFNKGDFSANLDSYNVGNFILKTYNGVTYAAVLADYNTFYNPGRNDYANVNENHWTAIVFGFTAGRMNSTNTTNGAMTGSAMNSWLKGECTNIVKAAFGEAHLIAHQCLLSAGNNGSFSWTWEDGHYTMIPSEMQVYGGCPCGIQFRNTGEASKQLSIFKEKSFMEVFGTNYGQSNADVFNTSNAWLRDISATSPGANFCIARCNGDANHGGASSSFGRFPLIILK